jgi:hypothetical protein
VGGADAPAHSALDEWLLDYHRPPGAPDAHEVSSLYRGPGIWGAVCVSLRPHAFSNMAVGFEGANGQLPNLDLVNSAVQVCPAPAIGPRSFSSTNAPAPWGTVTVRNLGAAFSFFCRDAAPVRQVPCSRSKMTFPARRCRPWL